MSKDLEEGEIEEGELLGDVADTSAGLDVSLITPGLFLAVCYCPQILCCSSDSRLL